MIDQKAISTELNQLYKKWPELKKYLKTLSCPKDEAEDIFQEALVIFTRKRQDSNFVLDVEPFFYVKNTCKFLWYNKARKNRKELLESKNESFLIEEDWYEKEEKIQTIELAMQKIGKQCQELLQLFYGLGFSMVEIAKKLDLRNDKVAKAQKYRCIQKVKDQIEVQHLSNH